MRGARVVKRYNRGIWRYVVWRQGKMTRTVKIGRSAYIVKRYRRGGKMCYIVRRYNRTITRCRKTRAGETINGLKVRFPHFNFRGAKVIRRYSRQGQRCIHYKRGYNQFHRCKWTGRMSGARIVRRLT